MRPQARGQRSKPQARQAREGRSLGLQDGPREVNHGQRDSDGIPKGFGRFNKRCPGIYSQEEVEAQQGHADRVCTADLIPEHKPAHEQDNDDSELESD